jgi:superfamily II DNA or RNA helicase
MLELREHQLAVVDKLKQGFLEGHRCQLLYAPTGFGKTEVAMSIMKRVADGFKKAAMVLDRIVLVEQTSLRLGKYDIDHGVMQAGHWRYRPAHRIQVCSAQTLEKRKSFPEIDLLIVDECFVAGTKISTPSGYVDIESVRCGDLVYNQCGVGIVEAVSIKPSNDLYKMEFDDGTVTECTGNHPHFTEQGWKTTRELEVGAYFFSVKGMRLLWEKVETLDQKRRNGKDDFGDAGAELEYASHLLSILCKEIKESNEQSSVSIKDEGKIEGNKTQAYQTWRERAIATLTAACTSSRIGRGMGIRASSSDKDATGLWLSNLLQDGLSKYNFNDWNRDRRVLSYNNFEEATGQEENRSSCFPRLVNISHIKREGVTPVFNLQVSGHPSYFANGKLVHNCHVQRIKTTHFIRDNPHIKVIGLTATPFTKGLGSTYTNVVGATSTGELVEKGWLVPLRVFIAKEINMEGAKKVAGEWAQDEVSKRGMEITGDVVSEWVKKTHEVFGGPRKTIVFCSGVDHGRDLQQQFAESGYKFISISYKEDDDYKRTVIEDFSRPDTDIVGLIATDILTRGFDVTDVMIGVSARPFSKSFSSHVQQLGRVMRPHQGKEFGLWLDNSGNYLRFREDWDELFNEGVKTLKEGGEKAKNEPPEKVKKESKCPKCQALWVWPDDKCGGCGFIRVRMSSVVSKPGQLEELQAASKNLSIEKQAFYSQILYYARARGFKDGWAAHKYKEKFGVWPRGLTETSELPTPATVSWIKSRAIAFAKSKARAA